MHTHAILYIVKLQFFFSTVIISVIQLILLLSFFLFHWVFYVSESGRKISDIRLEKLSSRISNIQFYDRCIPSFNDIRFKNKKSIFFKRMLHFLPYKKICVPYFFLEINIFKLIEIKGKHFHEFPCQWRVCKKKK